MDHIEHEDKNSVAELLTAGRALGAPIDAANGAQHMVVPKGYSIHELVESDKPPVRAKSRVLFEELASFCEYFNRFKNENSVIFASQENVEISAFIDYHAPKADAGHRDHRLDYKAPVSLEWQRWSDIDGEFMDQVNFAHFIEENMADIREPAGADILEIATSLQAKRNVSFKSVKRLQDGTQEYEYTETINDVQTKGGLRIPEKFVLGIPVFFGGEPYKIEALLRYRISQHGALTFKIDLHRKEYIKQDAFKGLTKEAAEKCETFVYAAHA